MKLRCTTNSIRFRLRKSDVKLLLENFKLKDSIHFPNGVSFVYGLVLTNSEASTYCKNNCVIIEVNRSNIKSWVNSDDVSLSFEFPVFGNKILSILIEKDFPCKHTGDDFDDTYHELQPDEFKMYKNETFKMN